MPPPMSPTAIPCGPPSGARLGPFTAGLSSANELTSSYITRPRLAETPLTLDARDDRGRRTPARQGPHQARDPRGRHAGVLRPRVRGRPRRRDRRQDADDQAHALLLLREQGGP